MSLSEKSALVRYNGSKITEQNVVEYIEDMGFEASLPSGGMGDKKVECCVIGVEGMTCNSCVQSIEGKDYLLQKLISYFCVCVCGAIYL